MKRSDRGSRVPLRRPWRDAALYGRVVRTQRAHRQPGPQRLVIAPSGDILEDAERERMMMGVVGCVAELSWFEREHGGGYYVDDLLCEPDSMSESDWQL